MKAKEMFEKLEYKKFDTDCNVIFSYKSTMYDTSINFNGFSKQITISTLNERLPQNIDMEELQAINKQIEALGWNKNDKDEHGYWSNGIVTPSIDEQYQGIIREYQREIERLTKENKELRQKLYGQTNIFDFIGDDEEC